MMTHRLPLDNPPDLRPPGVMIVPARRIFIPGEPVVLASVITNPNPWRVDIGTGFAHRNWLTITLTDEAGNPVPETPDTRWMENGIVQFVEMVRAFSACTVSLPLDEWFGFSQPGRFTACIRYHLPYGAVGTFAHEAMMSALSGVVGHMKRKGDRIAVPDNGLFPFITGSCQVDFEIMPENEETGALPATP